MRFLKYIPVFIFGLLVGKLLFEARSSSIHQQEQVSVMISTIKQLSKLVISEATVSEMYNYSESKKYFFDVISFDKKAIVTINAKVEVGYDLSKLIIEVDSLQQKIHIKKIPEASVNISPDVQYFDLQQSAFNRFSKEELNSINQKSIEKIKETVVLSNLKKEAKTRLFEELSKLYQLSAIYGWQVVDDTSSQLLKAFTDNNRIEL